jgi:hypothetical protein
VAAYEADYFMPSHRRQADHRRRGSRRKVIGTIDAYTALLRFLSGPGFSEVGNRLGPNPEGLANGTTWSVVPQPPSLAG